ncbi:unnamed protein product, partial [Heterotrigona itama]
SSLQRLLQGFARTFIAFWRLILLLFLDLFRDFDASEGRTAGEQPSECSDLCSLSTSDLMRTVVLEGSLEVILEKGEASLVVRRSSELLLR